jgi:DNA-binding response OmpR family regulator
LLGAFETTYRLSLCGVQNEPGSRRARWSNASPEGPIATPIIRTDNDLPFGPFNLLANRRLLTKEDVHVEPGAGSVGILVAVVSNANEIVSKKDLSSPVWPDVIVAATVR